MQPHNLGKKEPISGKGVGREKNKTFQQNATSQKNSKDALLGFTTSQQQFYALPLLLRIKNSN